MTKLKIKEIKGLIWVMISIFICLLIAPASFLINFFHYAISNDPKDWGAFGDYFGGILNPVISLISTIILAYLTYFVYKNSSIENKKVFDLEQKSLAYQYISLLSNNIEVYLDQGVVHNDLMVKLGKMQIKGESVSQYIKAMEGLNLISQFKVGICNFDKNYGHLFNYNFESPEFIELKTLAEQYFWNLIKIARKGDDPSNVETIDEIDEKHFFSLISEFLDSIRKELIDVT